jgi:ketosteroid isomerase-like protein
MPVEESRACLRRWVEVYNAHDVDALLALYAPGHTVNGRPVPGEAAHRARRPTASTASGSSPPSRTAG